MAPSRKSWSFTIHLYWDFSKSWSQIQKVGVNYSKFGVNETSGDHHQTQHSPNSFALFATDSLELKLAYTAINEHANTHTVVGTF